MTRVLAVLVAALALVLVPATAALATFRGNATAATAVGTATLAPPTALANESTCNFLVQTVRVSWTASTSARATGYAVAVTVNGSTSTTTTTATSFQQSMLLGAGKSYTVAVRTVLGGWTSTAPAVAFTC